MADNVARIIAYGASAKANNLTASDISGLGTAAVKNTGTSASQIPVLDAQGKILTSVIPSSVTGGKIYVGTWDASTGVYPVATIIGQFWTINKDGIINATSFYVNDEIIWNGVTFDAIHNSSTITFAQDIKRIGFTNDTDTLVPFLSGAEKDIINLNDAGAKWSYYKDGLKHTITGNKTIAITGGAGNAHTNGIYWVVIANGDGNLSISQNEPNFTTEIIVARVYWNGSLPSGNRSIIIDERHTILWDSSVHKEIHSAIGAFLTDDIAMSTYNLDSVPDINKQYSLSGTTIHDEDLLTTISPLVGGVGTYKNFCRTALDIYGWTDSLFPFLYATNGRLKYDNGIGGAECGEGKFINTYNCISNADVYFTITSQTQYDSESEARREHFTDLDTTGIFLNETVITHRITWQTSDTFIPSTGKCKMTYVRPIMENAIYLKRLYRTKTNDVAPSMDRNYVTDAQLTAITHTNRTNLDTINQSLSTTSTPTFAQLTVGDVSNTELQYLNGVTSAIQTQFSGKEPTITKNTAFNKDYGTLTSNVKQNGLVSVGSVDEIARIDHIHPSYYGGVYSDNTAGTTTLTLSSSANYYQWASGTAGVSNGIIVATAPPSLTILNNGIYEISANCSVESNKNADYLDFVLYKDGVIVPQFRCYQTKILQSSGVTFSFTGKLSLVAGNVLTLMFKCQANTTILKVYHVNFGVHGL